MHIPVKQNYRVKIIAHIIDLLTSMTIISLAGMVSCLALEQVKKEASDMVIEMTTQQRSESKATMLSQVVK